MQLVEDVLANSWTEDDAITVYDALGLSGRLFSALFGILTILIVLTTTECLSQTVCCQQLAICTIAMVFLTLFNFETLHTIETDKLYKSNMELIFIYQLQLAVLLCFVASRSFGINWTTII